LGLHFNESCGNVTHTGSWADRQTDAASPLGIPMQFTFLDSRELEVTGKKYAELREL
jgi:hypothetical protein